MPLPNMEFISGFISGVVVVALVVWLLGHVTIEHNGKTLFDNKKGKEK